MSKIEYAKELIKYFNERGIRFQSHLKDKDFREVEKENKILKFFKYKYTDIELTEELAEQVVNFNKVREYKSMLDSFYERKTRTESGLLIFTYKVTPDYTAAGIADLLRNTCGIILDAYQQKKDTPEFDKGVTEIVDILDKSIVKEPVGDYGVIFGYSIEKTPRLTPEDKEQIIEFQYRTLGPETQEGKSDEGM